MTTESQKQRRAKIIIDEIAEYGYAARVEGDVFHPGGWIATLSVEGADVASFADADRRRGALQKARNWARARQCMEQELAKDGFRLQLERDPSCYHGWVATISNRDAYVVSFVDDSILNLMKHVFGWARLRCTL